MLKSGRKIWLSIVSLMVALLFSVEMQSQSGNNFVLNTHSLTKISVENNIEDIVFDTISDYFQVQVSDNYTILHTDDGRPSLPVISKIIALPIGCNIDIKIVKSTTQEYNLERMGIKRKMYPIQPSLSKSNNGNSGIVVDSKIYLANKYYKNELIAVEEMGTMRGTRLARLTISPFEYNPITNSLIVYSHLLAEITFGNVDAETTVTNLKSTYSAYYNMHTINVANAKAYSNVIDLFSDVIPPKYVVVARDSFREALQPFVEWKKQLGYDMVEYYPSYAANRDTIKAELTKMYNSRTPLSPAPTFLLIVGDVEQIHSFIGKYTIPGGETHATDLYYAEYTGDIYPDVLFGRMSVRNTGELQNVINKTIAYEQYCIADTTNLNKALLVAGKENRTPAPTVTNGMLNYIKTTLNTDFGMDTIVYYNPTSYDKRDEILQQLSTNPGFVNYTGHCTTAGWSSPAIGVTDIATLPMEGKYSFVVNNCCKSNNFTIGECFGEALMRKENGGAIGVIGASNETLWNEDYYWGVGAKYPFSLSPSYQSDALGAFDRWFHTRMESVEDYVLTQGQMLQAGNMAVSQAGSPYENYYWEIYNLLGDPSLMPYLGRPKQLVLSIDTIRKGDSQIECNGTPWAHVAIYADSLLLGTTILDLQGNGTIYLKTPVVVNNLLLTATAQYYKPLIDTITVLSANNEKVVLTNYYFSDTLGNILHELYPNQQVELHGRLLNVGENTVDSLCVVVENIGGFSGIYVENISDSLLPIQEYIGKIASFVVENSVENKEVLSLLLKVKSTDNTLFEKNLNIMALSSKIEHLWVEFKHAETSNTALSLQADSTYVVEVPLVNVGSYVSDTIIVSLSTNSSAIVTADTIATVLQLHCNDTAKVFFEIKVSSNPDTAVNLKINITDRNRYYNTNNYYTIGRAVETFETGNFTLLDWDTVAAIPWFIDSTADNACSGRYSARSGKIRGRQISVLKLPLETLADDTISFWARTSTEASYDVLTFYIDGNKMGAWSGRKAWTCYKFPIARGHHELKWEYKKDDETSSGSDAVWIDNLELPIAQYNHPIVKPDSTIGITDELDIALFSKVYPNPAKDYVVFEFNIPNRIDISIYNSQGVQMDSFTTNGTRWYTYSTKNYKSGNYIVVLKSKHHTITEKLLILK